MALVAAWCLIIFMLSVTLCIPLDKFWNLQKPGGCLEIKAFYYGMQIPNILTDFFIVVCPVHEVYHRYPSHVHNSRRTKSSMKAAIGMMFVLGFLWVDAIT
ncbi:hypothetical protein LTR09_012775 [Extremus antarcticus]|uniref:Rhodopsin domain-containing protein n=1 Tax=Extremus antarcticus TaxID=702011 RepID=A0AAJ0D9B2_9PEZI|nr:hypothetical protein LTR09_012775 [Extremus antarcticus]